VVELGLGRALSFGYSYGCLDVARGLYGGGRGLRPSSGLVAGLDECVRLERVE
jgi:hypothetical protein